MAKLYNFTRLINKYSNTFELITESDGVYVNGVWQAGLSTIKPMRGAIIPMSDGKIYQSGGTLTKSDRNLYTIEPIPNPLNNQKVRYKGKTYSVEEETDYSDYADAYVYVLKRVESFDKPKTE